MRRRVAIVTSINPLPFLEIILLNDDDALYVEWLS